MMQSRRERDVEDKVIRGDILRDDQGVVLNS